MRRGHEKARRQWPDVVVMSARMEKGLQTEICKPF